MKKLALLAAATLPFLTANALAQTAASPTTSSQPATQTGQQRPAVEDTSSHVDDDFVQRAALGSLLEIEAGKLALERSSDPRVRDLAQRIITDHTKANAMLQEVAGSSGEQLPTRLGGEGAQMVEDLKAHQGAAFDRAYLAAMVGDHNDDIELFESEAQNGRDARVRQYASQITPILKEHLELATALQQSVGKAS